MPTAAVNTTEYIPFTVLDALNDPVTGKVNADFTSSAYLTSAPGTTATPTISEVGGGQYVLSVTPTAIGTWHVAWSVDVDGETVRYEDVLEVVTAQQADPVSYLGGASVEVVSPVSITGDVISLIAGDDYLATDGRALEWDFVGAADLTSATVTLTLRYRGSSLAVTATVSNAGATTQTVSADLTSTQTDALHNGSYVLAAVLSGGSSATLARGKLRVTPG